MASATDTDSLTTDHDEPRYTVVGLFDVSLDAEQALVALRRADRAPEQVSLVIRDRTVDEDRSTDHTGAVAKALVASAMGAVGGWLHGLASLIVPERGTFLVAGPLGAALARVGNARDREDDVTLGMDATVDQRYTSTTELGSAGLLRTLTAFGFPDDEATYLENRLAAGAALIAVTTADADQVGKSRKLFGDHSAVHIGVARTAEHVVNETTAALTGMARWNADSDIVVSDAVAPLRHLCAITVGVGPATICGRDVVDAIGTPAGVIQDLLADPIEHTDDGMPVIRYAIVAFGGRLRIGRQHVAVPASLIDLSVAKPQLNMLVSVLRDAPTFNPSGAFSRREELAVCTFFGAIPYWLESERS